MQRGWNGGQSALAGARLHDSRGEVGGRGPCWMRIPRE